MDGWMDGDEGPTRRLRADLGCLTLSLTLIYPLPSPAPQPISQPVIHRPEMPTNLPLPVPPETQSLETPSRGVMRNSRIDSGRVLAFC